MEPTDGSNIKRNTCCAAYLFRPALNFISSSSAPLGMSRAVTKPQRETTDQLNGVKEKRKKKRRGAKEDSWFYLNYSDIPHVLSSTDCYYIPFNIGLSYHFHPYHASQMTHFLGQRLLLSVIILSLK